MSITKSWAKAISNYTDPNSIGSRFRAKRIVPLLELIEAVSKEYKTVKIIDVGGTMTYWGIVSNDFLKTRNVNITIVNLPGTTLPKNNELFTFKHADGCDLSGFENNSFHIAHSNSVIEHVGDWEQMVKFSNEIKRVAGKYFVQTPNYWFPIEPHCMTPFFHWLPKSLRVWLVMNFALGHWRKATSTDEAIEIVESARLLSKRKFRSLFSDSDILTEKFFLLPKSFIAFRR